MAIEYVPIKVLFEFGSIKLYSYGSMLALAFLLAIIFAVKEAKKRSVDPINIYWLALIAVFSGILGGRLFFILGNLSYYLSNPGEILIMSEGGNGFYGGLILGIILFIIYLKATKLKVLKLFDIISPSIILGLAITRIGCFLNWCCYGIQSNLPWAVKVGEDVARHPTQLYSLIADFIIFIYLYRLNQNKNTTEGKTTAMFFILYGLFRFMIEFIRFSEFKLFSLLSVPQIISLCFVIAGIIIIKKINFKQN